FPRVKVAEASLNGHAGEADGLIPDGMLGRVWSPTVPPFDPAAAEREIAASKYRSATAMPTLTIYTAGGGPAEALRDVLQESLGLDVEVVSLEWPQFLDGLARRALPAYGLYWMADYPDPESLLWTLFGTDSPDNYVDYRSPIFDGLLREAAAEPDGERRADLYQQAQQALLNDYVILPMYDDIAFTLAKPEVKDLEVTPLGILRLETVWLER
ncbi:MAG: ABC transporter substrate-binding protein, partial [Chloroflexota bacterium]|nr:ABC transporter substrate-binding protein [Chloroflexota bacterium]